MTAHALVTVAEYAGRRGVTRAAVYKAILRCRIPTVDGKLDPLVADTLWTARTDPDQQKRSLGQKKEARGQPPAGEGATPSNDWTWRNRLEAAQARRAELELMKFAGELGSLSEIDRIYGVRLAGIKVQLDALPARAAAAFGVDDAHRRKVLQWLRDELAQILSAATKPEAA